MARLFAFAALACAALWLGASGAAAYPVPDDDEAPTIAKKKRDGGSRDEEKEEELRRY